MKTGERQAKYVVCIWVWDVGRSSYRPARRSRSRQASSFEWSRHHGKEIVRYFGVSTRTRAPNSASASRISPAACRPARTSASSRATAPRPYNSTSTAWEISLLPARKVVQDRSSGLAAKVTRRGFLGQESGATLTSASRRISIWRLASGPVVRGLPDTGRLFGSNEST
jgi:hypothetical protein